MFRKVSVIGGDMRQLTVARELSKDDYDVVLFGFEKKMIPAGIKAETELGYALNSDIIVLPVPVTLDNSTVNMLFCDIPLDLDTLVKEINPASIVFGGQIPVKLSQKMTDRGIKHYDYMKRDELAIRNAIPTAEGAVEVAISETPITIHNSKCLVIGYGKVGKTVSYAMYALGAKTYVAARKYADLALIEGRGCHPLTLNESRLRLSEFDIIINTVPALVLNSEELSKVPRSALIIDLASKPGGVDFEAAKKLGLNVIWALSLPGRVAPVTAGIIIKDTIINILDELEV